MRGLLASLYVLFLACLFASAARYQWEDDGYNYLREDAPGALATEPPLWYNKHVDMSTPPLNRTIGSGIINLLVGRVAILASLSHWNPRRRTEFANRVVRDVQAPFHVATMEPTAAPLMGPHAQLRPGAVLVTPRRVPAPQTVNQVTLTFQATYVPVVCITAEETCCGTGACTVGSTTSVPTPILHGNALIIATSDVAVCDILCLYPVILTHSAGSACCNESFTCTGE